MSIEYFRREKFHSYPCDNKWRLVAASMAIRWMETSKLSRLVPLSKKDMPMLAALITLGVGFREAAITRAPL
jgi:hypothetical protein